VGRYIRIICNGYSGQPGAQESCSMTSITVNFDDREMDFEQAKAKALGRIVEEFCRYGLHEALNGIGILDEHGKRQKAAARGEFRTCMGEDTKPPEQALFELERQIRHQQAIRASDVKNLIDSLRNAADRFADLADLIEKDRSYDPVNFMRASAERYRRIAEAT
jgi:hypothetical protein